MLNSCSLSRRGLLGLAIIGLPGLLNRQSIAADELSSQIYQPDEPGDKAFIERAFKMRQQAIDSGDQAYGAIVVLDGVIVGQAASHVLVRNDPTAHAEMEAIRDAARRLKRRDLSSCKLYSSSAACPMCEAAAYWAGIERMVYGETIRDGGRPGLC